MFNQYTIRKLQALASMAEMIAESLHELTQDTEGVIDPALGDEQLFDRATEAFQLKENLGGTLIAGTAAAHVVFAEKNPNSEGRQYRLLAFSVSKYLPRTVGELIPDDEGVDYSFQVAEEADTVVMRLPRHERDDVRLAIDDESGWLDPSGSVVAAFSTTEKLNDWCLRRFGEQPHATSGRNEPQNIVHQWW
jgi:hypothetical protein